MTRGIIYFNSGLGCLLRMAVSIHSLRKVYQGDITILCDKASYSHCEQIGKLYNVNAKEIDVEKLTKNTALLNKCRMHELTPYDVSVFIDADTIVYRDVSYLFNLAEKFEFVATQFCEWTTKDRRIQQRILQWESICSSNPFISIEKAIGHGPAINTGVFAFTKNSKLMARWYDFALQGLSFFIPDEIACQILIAHFPSYIADHTYNESCKYGFTTSQTKVLHFHGRKHCRISSDGKPIYNSHLWYKEFDEVRNLKEVSAVINFDKHVSRHFQNWDANKSAPIQICDDELFSTL